MEIIDTLCGDCKEKEFKYEYHFPHPEQWYWYCNALQIKLEEHSGVRRSWRCPKLVPTKGGFCWDED